MDILSYQVPLWGVLLYYFISAAIGSMPSPDDKSSKGYQWLFATLNTFAANTKRAGIAFTNKTNGLPKPENGGK